MKFIGICNQIIRYGFYTLFFLVPLTFTSSTSELFEFNKMWLTFGLTIIIVGAWMCKMILEKRVIFCRTPLDIPILLFLLSQFIATIHSLDTHVSLWGYYSRFNGGFLSILAYVLLYYAFVNNFLIGVTRAGAPRAGAPSLLGQRDARGAGERQDPNHYSQLDAISMVKHSLLLSLASGAIVALWGLPAHFGYDPTCLIFRGTLDVSCWTDAFQPKIRIFSTLGQPDWLAAYLAALIPIAIAFAIAAVVSKELPKQKKTLYAASYAILSALFYSDLLFTRAKSGFLAIWAALIVLLIGALSLEKFSYSTSVKKLSRLTVVFVLLTFFITSPFPQLDKFSFSGVQQMLNKKQPVKTNTSNTTAVGELGGTDSGKIRLIVWQGAIEAWKKNPIIGTGVETFAFAYYKYRPAAHNLTSEWDYLYNKAHNEYLNYLTTTGIFGLGSYLLIIGTFLYVSLKLLLKKKPNSLLVLGIAGGYVSILVSNFFGFSVVNINIFFFLFPAFVFMLGGHVSAKDMAKILNDQSSETTSGFQWLGVILSIMLSGYLLFGLVHFWQADTSYAYGYNLNRAGQYQLANSYLRQAVIARDSEPTFQDELSMNDATLSLSYALQKDATSAAQLAQEAIVLSNQTVSQHQNNVVFWKTRTRVFYTLSQLDPKYTQYAIDALRIAQSLAPTDAKIAYNLGVLEGQNGDQKQAIETLKQTIAMKPDYTDAYYALGLFYRNLAIDKKGNVIDRDMEQKAVDTMHYILEKLDPKNDAAQKSLTSWGEQIK